MTIDEIKELIQVLMDTGIAELEYRRGDESLKIRRAITGVNHEVVLPTVLPASIAAPGGSYAPPSAAPAFAAPAGPAEDDRNTLVKSPIVGTYYDAPSPGTAPFVKVGDKVHAKQVLCIIESMKLMNEIEAEISGTIVAKFVENGRPVEYGESLFTIRPA
jgi:acetyl-CoA carboxylase biotin carboxyl carrier protein